MCSKLHVNDVPNDSPCQKDGDKDEAENRHRPCIVFLSVSDIAVKPICKEDDQKRKHAKQNGIIPECSSDIKLQQADQHARDAAAGALEARNQMK